MSAPNEKYIATATTGDYQQSNNHEEESLDPRDPHKHDKATLTGFDKVKEFLARIWAYEIFSVLVSMGAIGAMVGVLAYMDNKPLSSWHARVGPNTVISILSTLCKATVLTVIGSCLAQLRWVHYRTAPQKLGDIDTFAKATGTTGSLKLLSGVSKKHTSGRVASFAAFLIVIAIAIDPFSQQILKYQVKNDAVVGSIAKIPIAKSIGNAQTILNNNEAWRGLYAGLLGFDFPLPITCYSGNCTWPAFSTLGICGSCQAAPTLFGNENSTTVEASMGNLSMTLNNGVLPTSGNPNATGSWTLVKSAVSDSYPNGLQDPAIFQVLLAQFLLDSSHKADNFTPAWNLTTCSVGWCGRVYENVQVNKGNLTQPEPTVINLESDPNSNCYNGQSSTPCQEFMANSSIANETYRINVRPDASNIRQLLNFDEDVDALEDNTWNYADSITVTASLFWNINATASFARACDTFTDFMRSDHTLVANGTTFQTTTYIHIRWPWLALPAGIVACTMVLLVIVMCINRGTMLWKGSSLPLLLHPVDYHGQSHLAPDDAKPHTLNKQADKMHVKLVNREDGGLKFAVTRQDPKLARTQSAV